MEWDSTLTSKSLPPKAFGLDSPNHPISNLRSGRGVDVHLSFLRLSRSGWRWVHHRGVTLFFFRRRIRHGRFLLLTSREQGHASEQTNISSHVSKSNLRTNLALFRESTVCSPSQNADVFPRTNVFYDFRFDLPPQIAYRACAARIQKSIPMRYCVFRDRRSEFEVSELRCFATVKGL